MYPAVALLGSALLLADWQSIESLRSSLPRGAKPVAHWRSAGAAFLAARVPGKGVWSVVRVNGGKTEIRFDGQVRTDAKGPRLTSLGLQGVVVGTYVVLFNTEPRPASSAISFDTGKSEAANLQCVVTGIAPGMWELWRDGWVVEIGVPVRAGEGVLAFDCRPGSYFIRRLQ